MSFRRQRPAHDPGAHVAKAHIALACVDLGDIRRIQKFTGQRAALQQAGEALNQELMGRSWQEPAPLAVAHAPLQPSYSPQAPRHAMPVVAPGLIPQVTSGHPATAFASLSVQRP